MVQVLAQKPLSSNTHAKGALTLLCGKNGELPSAKFSASLGPLSSVVLSVLGWSQPSAILRLAPIRYVCGYPPPNPIHSNTHIHPICNSLRDLSLPLFLSMPFQLIFLILTVVCVQPFLSLPFLSHVRSLIILSLARFPHGKSHCWSTYLYLFQRTTSLLSSLILLLLSPVLLPAMAELFRITLRLAG